MAGSSSEGSGSNQLREPRCVYVDANETLYICDSGNHRIQRWVKGASVGTTVAGGSAGTTLTQLNGPRGLTFDKNGFMYVADTENHRILRYTLTSTVGTLVVGTTGVGGSANNLLVKPVNIIFADNQTMYVADMDNKRVMRYAPNATTGTSLFNSLSDKPYGIAFRKNVPNQFFVTIVGTKQLELWTAGASSPLSIVGTSPAHFGEPHTIINDLHGNLYVADFIGGRVQMFCNNGSWASRTVIGSGLGATPSLVETPGIAFDSAMNLYITSKSPPGIYRFARI